MGWDLHKAELPPEARDFLSLLSSCGDERQAAADAGVSEADLRKWQRLDVFLIHRQQAVAHFAEWADWTPQARDSAPEARFIALEDMSPGEARIAAAQQGLA